MEPPPPEAPYRTPGDPVPNRVADLLDRMTFEEQLGQLLAVASSQDADDAYESITEQVEDFHLGVASPYGRYGAPADPARCASLVNRLQRYALEETRLGIPLMIVTNATHGHGYVEGATVFPHQIGLAATRDRDLVERTAAVTARELAATGGDVTHAPVCDVARDVRWGRTYETFGESPRLCADLGAAAVGGYQGESVSAPDRVLATAKHFPAYSESVQGQDSAPVDVSPTTFRRVHVPPFEAAVDAGCGAIMPSLGVVDAEPAHGSRRYLGDLLRGQLDFEGVVISDYDGAGLLATDYGTAADHADAARQALEAGVDVFLDRGLKEEYVEPIEAGVATGAIDPALVERACGRVLRAKLELGLFEDPYVDESVAEATVTATEHRELSRRAARQSLTLLQNENGVLPLAGDEDLLVTGPNADAIDHQVGGWTRRGGAGTTVLEGLREASDGTVTHEPGAGIREPVAPDGEPGTGGLDAAAEAAADADAAVVVLGENQYFHEFGPQDRSGPTGAFPSRTQLRLPAAQRELAARVAANCERTAVVLLTGRPNPVPDVAAAVPAMLMAYYPGSAGGQAVADVLYGEVDPGGALPISIPRSTSRLPTRFNELRHPLVIGTDEHPDPYDPLFGFGHGLSYGEVRYADLSVSAASVGPAGRLTATVELENRGDRPAEVPVDLLVRDEVSSRVTPRRELLAFGRTALDPGETAEVGLEVDAEDLGVVQPGGRRVTEPGEFTLFAGDREAVFEVEAR